MTNVNSAADLAKYAEEHDIDLIGYGETLATIASWGEDIDPEQSFAEHVLERLRLGDSITDAVAAAHERANAQLRKPSADQ